MAKKHWHLTTDVVCASNRGAPIQTRRDAEGKAAILRQNGVPVYAVACQGKHRR